MRRIILIALSGTILGACSIAVNDVPQTTPPGKFKLGVAIGSDIAYTSDNFSSTPIATVMGRYGLNYNTDIGFRVFRAGFGLEGKRAFTDRMALSIGVILNKPADPIFYDLYGTLLYGFRSTGSIPYLYIRPMIVGYIGNSGDGSFPAGLALQGGFGYHGDPDKFIQPSAEIGFITPLSGSFRPDIILSLGLNLQLGD